MRAEQVEIEGLKLVHLTGRRDTSLVDKDDPAYPYRLYVNCSPPEMMTVAFVMLYGGSEEMIVRATTREALDQFIALNSLRAHPRLRRMEITGPDGLREEIKR